MDSNEWSNSEKGPNTTIHMFEYYIKYARVYKMHVYHFIMKKHVKLVGNTKEIKTDRGGERA